MKKIIILFIMLIISEFSFADTTAFNITLDKTTINEFKKIYKNIDYKGINKYSEGKMYSINYKDIEIDNLENLLVIFDKNEKVTAILAYFKKIGNFDYFNNILKNKYKLITKRIPYVGDKYAKYKNGQDLIEIDAPHLSFQMVISYQTATFVADMNKKIQIEKNNKVKREKSLL